MEMKGTPFIFLSFLRRKRHTNEPTGTASSSVCCRAVLIKALMEQKKLGGFFFSPNTSQPPVRPSPSASGLICDDPSAETRAGDDHGRRCQLAALFHLKLCSSPLTCSDVR